jgi:anti-sigma regulatory factor (Ser/Thr protein kinase)
MGPGFAQSAFADGFSEGRLIHPDDPRKRGQGLGIGLGTVRRLMDDVEVRHGTGGGFVIVARRWPRASH